MNHLNNNYKLIISYDGTQYFGWQKSQDGPTIEGELEKALLDALDHPVCLQAASRTDRGVHALGQVVNFFSPLPTASVESLLNKLNALLPQDISILSIRQAPQSFHPTLEAKEKEYHYNICNQSVQEAFYSPFSWHIPTPLNFRAMQQATTLLMGNKDFSAFSNTSFPKRENTVCHLRKITISPLKDNRLRISLIGNRFLYKMARNLVGTLVYVGLGKLEPACIGDLLERKNRSLAGVTAPACGLFLKKVAYEPTLIS